MCVCGRTYVQVHMLMTCLYLGACVADKGTKEKTMLIFVKQHRSPDRFHC